jgi:excisionase family DNA binding protein
MERLLTIPEVADRLAVSRAFVYELVAAGEIPAVSIGRARRVPESELDGYVHRLVDERRERMAAVPMGR